MGALNTVVCTLSPEGGLRTDKTLVISGRIPVDARRFAIDLVCENKWNIAFRFCPQFEGVPVVGCKTKKNGWWSTEQQNFNMPFLRGDSFEMAIAFNGNCYEVYIDRKPYLEYNHRLGHSRVWTVQVLGDLHLDSIGIDNLPPYFSSEYKEVEIMINLKHKQSETSDGAPGVSAQTDQLEIPDDICLDY